MKTSIIVIIIIALIVIGSVVGVNLQSLTSTAIQNGQRGLIGSQMSNGYPTQKASNQIRLLSSQQANLSSLEGQEWKGIVEINCPCMYGFLYPGEWTGLTFLGNFSFWIASSVSSSCGFNPLWSTCHTISGDLTYISGSYCQLGGIDGAESPPEVFPAGCYTMSDFGTFFAGSGAYITGALWPDGTVDLNFPVGPGTVLGMPLQSGMSFTTTALQVNSWYESMPGYNNCSPAIGPAGVCNCTTSNDPIDQAFCATTTVIAYPVDTTTLNCHPYTQLVGQTVDCVADVTGDYPSGTVTFTAQLPNGKTLGPSTCSLNGGLPATELTESCWYQIKSYVRGPVTITGQYSGDYENSASSATSIVNFVTIKSQSSPYTTSSTSSTISITSSTSNTASSAPPPDTSIVVFTSYSNVNVTCSPSAVNATVRAPCTATVSGSLSTPIPTGTITWNEISPAGFFSNSTCVLLNGSCSVEFSDATTPATIIATYSGDSYYAPSQGTNTLLIIRNGTASADESQETGLTVSVTGANANGTFADASSNIYIYQPSNTGNAPFAMDKYFDLKITPVSSGTARVCYNGPEVNATTSLDYYYNNRWNSAADINATIGVSVCGSIPVPALSGTPLAIGEMNSTSAVTTSYSATLSTSTSSTSHSSQFISCGTNPDTAGCPYPGFAGLALFLIIVIVIIVGAAMILRRRKHG